jgi:hypothetical protein
MKIVSEELRGLATEKAIPIVSSVQTNRGGQNEVDLEITDIAESFGTTNTADIIIAVVQTDEMKIAGRYTFILSKNRYGLDKLQIMIGVDYNKMRLFEVSDDNENSGINTSHGKPITPKGTESTMLVDEAAVKVLKTMKQNKTAKKNKIFKGKPDINI